MSKLTDAAVKAAKHDGTVQKLRDGNGLYLHVLPSGRYWRYDYRYAGKRKTLSLGVYPTVSLKQARIDLFEAKGKLNRGIDPSYEKQLRKHIAGNTFQAVAEDFIRIQDWDPSHQRTIELRVQKDLYPKIGDMPIEVIGPQDVLGVLRTVESRGAVETAHRIKTITGQIMRYAVAIGLISSDPTRDLRGVLKTPRTKRHSAITDRALFGKLLRAIDTYDHSIVVAHALRLAPHVVLRPGEIRGASWSEVDFEGKLWEIQAERMKKRRAHFVPLTDQSISILRSVKQYTGQGELIFPSLRAKGRPISEGTLNAALKYLGYTGDIHTPHGFRSTFSTMAYEADRFDGGVIEMQLAHQDQNSVRSAYKRGEHLKQRRELMEWWSNEIDIMRRLSQGLPTTTR